MKLKQCPDDFQVVEQSSVVPSAHPDRFQVFLLKKQGIDTFEALRLVARRWRVPLFEIGYAGLKDKHAVTQQYISIATSYTAQGFKSEQLETRFMGYTKNKILIGDLTGNQFVIVIRDLTDQAVDEVLCQIPFVQRMGVPNYFDSQRFGSVIRQQFIAKVVLQGDCEKAVRWFLTAYQKYESRTVKDDKRRLLAAWPHIGDVRILDKNLARVVDGYKNSGDWGETYRQIPVHLRELFKNAYQSYLWNESVKELLMQLISSENLFSVPYAVGSLLFFRELDDRILKEIPATLPTLSWSMSHDFDTWPIIQKVLQREGVSLSWFERFEKITGTFFSSLERSIVVVPQKFSLGTISPDDLNSSPRKKRYKMVVQFGLPKGCYATIVTKRMFGH
ncbi:MAG: tRNA pseudouridine(13) synthase TruD [Candidatus Thermoplasmatota archaeon]|nr:tRNA pseudouridine(13) synthase TruD [Candidatus Thermoplasmatota archaeon]MBU1940317.1 tRNA pseudouridine(13) synthase TruD [Candidatus Thermoplasmatota archaeon]